MVTGSKERNYIMNSPPPNSLPCQWTTFSLFGTCGDTPLKTNRWSLFGKASCSDQNSRDPTSKFHLFHEMAEETQVHSTRPSLWGTSWNIHWTLSQYIHLFSGTSSAHLLRLVQESPKWEAFQKAWRGKRRGKLKGWGPQAECGLG